MSRVTVDTGTTVERTVAALKNPATLYTADQVAWIVQRDREARNADPDDPAVQSLMYSAGFEAGYQARVAEENADYRLACEQLEADPARGDLRRLIETVDARREADRAARLPRPGDFAGGRPLPGRLGDQDELKEVA
jgi:hypothetical protein